MTYRDPTPLDPNKDYTAEELAQFIREKMHGIATREAMALSLLKANEVARWSSEVAQQIIDESFDSGELNTEIERKLNEIEQLYAPELDSVKSQLAEKAVHIYPTMSSLLIQDILDNFRKVLFTDGVFEVEPLFIRSNTEVTMSPNTQIKAKTGFDIYDRLISIDGVENITIQGNGAIVYMPKDEYTTGEWRHGVFIRESSNIAIIKLKAKDTGGDGFYVGAGMDPAAGPSHNISLLDCESDNNRRQGLSITNCDGFMATRCEFNNSNGTLPSAGVDIETNNPTDVLKRIVFNSCKAIGNEKDGFLVSLRTLNSTSDFVDIVFNQCESLGNIEGFSGNTNGFRVSYIGDNTKGTIKFIDCNAVRSWGPGFQEIDCSNLGIKREYVRCVGIDNNVGGGTAVSAGHGATFFSILTTDTIIGGNAHYYDCESFDSRGESKTIRGFSFSGHKFSNILLDNCESYGHNLEPLTFNNCENMVILHNRSKRKNLVFHSTIYNSSSWYEISNEGATSNIRYTLSTPTTGVRLRFKVESEYGIKLLCSTGLILPLSTINTPNLLSTTIGSYIELEGRSDGNWDVVKVIGEWTAVD